MANKGNSRANWHDYRSKCKYLITLKKSIEAPLFGELGHNLDNPRILLSQTGKAVRDSIWHISDLNPDVKLMQYIVMPDHAHALVNVTKPIDETIGQILAKMKVAANNKAGVAQVFENGFNDQIIGKNRSLEVIFNYIRSNPHRLAARCKNPEFFTRRDNIEINGTTYSFYGNLHLLDNPFKDQVVVHRADSFASRQHNKSQWLHTAANGGVLVSPFISRDEREVRDLACETDGRFIQIVNDPMDEHYKPMGRDFDLCQQGRLLIIAPMAQKTETLTRQACLEMNALAAHISTK